MRFLPSLPRKLNTSHVTLGMKIPKLINSTSIAHSALLAKKEKSKNFEYKNRNEAKKWSCFDVVMFCQFYNIRFIMYPVIVYMLFNEPKLVITFRLWRPVFQWYNNWIESARIQWLDKNNSQKLKYQSQFSFRDLRRQKRWSEQTKAWIQNIKSIFNTKTVHRSISKIRQSLWYSIHSIEFQ